MLGTRDAEVVESGPYVARGRTPFTALLSDENQFLKIVRAGMLLNYVQRQP
jgi:hypothetical protein